MPSYEKNRTKYTKHEHIMT